MVATLAKNYDSKNGNKPERFIMLEHWILKRPAWKSLTPREVRVLLLLLERHNGSNNGRIGLSVRDAANLGNMAQGTAKKAFDVLIAKGFVKRHLVGSFNQKVRLASEYELTHLRYGNKPPTKEFVFWRPEKTAVSNEVRVGLKLGGMSNEGVI